ncbi:aldehyde dehydrogenase family protein [Pusillimonas sp. ANT_WB101]|uniref:aldehyde dehydrogenase family protein n=1 Tax=Pusillimonas sp. ANT_WB101 TaxID=2597356 RepID=UPI002103B51B|nr:aldehyde dehydrogenase family protein [Pusillimonas sp. ANT_WB101]
MSEGGPTRTRKEKFTVRNPFNASIIGTIPNLGTVETVQAINAAEKALAEWKARTGKGRGANLEMKHLRMSGNFTPMS